MEYNKKIRETKSSIIEIVKNTLGNLCERCGKPGNQIHHPEYKKGMVLDDLELLCKSCHRREHAKYRERKDWSIDILSLMKSNPNKIWTLTEIVEKLDISKALLLNHIKPLLKKGLLTEDKGYINFYRLVK